MPHTDGWVIFSRWRQCISHIQKAKKRLPWQQPLETQKPPCVHQIAWPWKPNPISISQPESNTVTITVKSQKVAQVFCGMQIAECGKLLRGNLRKVKCRTFHKLPLIVFPHSATEKVRISADRKTTVRPHCTTDLQPKHSSIQRPSVRSFHILCGPFAKEQCSFILQFRLISLSSIFQG